MNWGLELALVFGAFIALMTGGMWVPFSIAVTALIYLFAAQGFNGFRALGMVSWGSTNSFTLTAIPMFILMAEFLLRSGLSTRVYRGMSQLVRKLPGGLLQTNIAGCGVFAAISGSSVATAASIGTVALPLLEERGYDRRLAVGTIAAGGTLGILIPPSIALIIYGTFTDASIAKLFVAGVIPGLLLIGLFMLYVGIVSLLRPHVAPRQADWDEPVDWRLVASDLLPFTVLIVTVIGSLFMGFATPTEAAAVGCVAAMFIARIWGTLDLTIFRQALQNTVRITGSIMFIVLAAFLFSYAIGMAGLPHQLAGWLSGLDMSRTAFLVMLVIGYIIMGCLVDSIGMMVITIPLLLPLLGVYGVDTIWFGIILVLLIEVGQVTPPMGINLFVIQSIRKEGSLEDVMIGAAPFVLLMLLAIVILWAWPELVLWLPDAMWEQR